MKVKVEDGKHKDSWRKWALASIFLFIVTTLVMVSGNKNPLEPNINLSTDICSQIEGTPAWTQGGNIIGYGKGFPENYAKQSFNDVVNDYLIPNKITFVWDEKCIHCQNQIKDFGDSLQDYQDSGLTIECHILK